MKTKSGRIMNFENAPERERWNSAIKVLYPEEEEK